MERKPKPGKCLYCEIELPDLTTHIEVGDLAALIQEVMLKLTDLESQIKQAHRQDWSKTTQLVQNRKLTDHHLSDDFVSIGEALPKVYRSLP
jgi:hypothetical protein